MSGSPLLTYINNNWKAVGMLIGGPAVAGHYHLMKLAACVKNDEMFNQCISQYRQLAQLKGVCDYKSVSKIIMSLKKYYGGQVLIQSLASKYYELLNHICYQITHRRGEDQAKATLNHNLALHLDDYRLFLDSFEEGKTPLNGDITTGSKFSCIIY